MSRHPSQPRRRFLTQTAAVTGAMAAGLPGILRAQTAPAIVTGDRPLLEQGLQIGDILADRAMIWSRSDRPARMIVEWSTSDGFHDFQRIVGPHAIEVSDFTARVDLTGLPTDQEIFVRVKFEDLETRLESEPAAGQFRTAPRHRRDISFTWSGDTAGQGWGINPDFGGMKIYESMRKAQPDFFIHSGDNIYADGVILPKVVLPDGTIWNNITTPAKSKVAETLDEFRGNYLYNLIDENVRRFNAEVPQIWQWDDHETLNNWSPGKDLSADARYTEKSILMLAGRSKRAFLEYSPMRWFTQQESERVYRQIPYGKLLDVFVLDMRSYRTANSFNRQPTPGPDTVYIWGAPRSSGSKLRWLRRVRHGR